MMEEPGGTALVENRSPKRSISAAPCAKWMKNWGADWWFKVTGPDDLSEEGMEEREAWMLKPGGVGTASATSPRLQPARPDQATVITPGLDVDGDVRDDIPAPSSPSTSPSTASSSKNGLYSFFIMFSSASQGPLEHAGDRAAAVQGRLRQNQPLWKVLPEFVTKHPRYERVGLRTCARHPRVPIGHTTWPAP